jgi:uncharacterized protein with GYD domain
MMGEYDLVVVTEVPNDETAAKMALGTAMQGNVRHSAARRWTRSSEACRGSKILRHPTCEM